MPIATALLQQIKANDPTLIMLNLCNQGLDAQDIQQLVEALLTNTTLKTLDISGNKIGDEGAQALAANTTLTTLNVSLNNIGVKGAQALAANTTLRTLDIHFSGVDDEGAKALATNTTLTTLDICNTKVGDEGAKALAANTTLTTLNISETRIGDEGAKALALNTTLTTLDLSVNEISDESVKALVANTTLTTLIIGYNLISNEGEQQLRQMIIRNQQQIAFRQNQFVQVLLLLACEKEKKHSSSLWAALPNELMRVILNAIIFHPTESIGKSADQITHCIGFVLDHSTTVKAAFEQKHGIKIIENMESGKSQFRFFQPPIQETSSPEQFDSEIIFRPYKKSKIL